MNGNIDTIVTNAQIEIKGAKNENMLNLIQHNYISNNGLLTRSLKSADQLAASFKEVRVRAITTAIRKLENQIDKKRKELKSR